MDSFYFILPEGSVWTKQPLWRDETPAWNDISQITLPNGLVIDIEFSHRWMKFGVRVIKDEDWDHPVRICIVDSIVEVVRNVQLLLEEFA